MLTTIRALVLLLGLLLAAPSWAGSLSLSATSGSATCPIVTAPVGGQTVTHCIAGTDAQLVRVAAAYRSLLELDPASTNAAVFQALAQRLFAEVKAVVQLYEQNQARISAETGVAPVDMQ